MSRTLNAWRNIMWGTANRIIKLLFPFLLRTLIIYEIGVEYLGLDGLFTSVLQMLNMAELGFASAIVFSMYKPLAQKDTPAICALLSFYRHVYHIIGVIVLILGLILIPFLPNLIAGHVPADVNLYTLYVIYLLNTVLGYFLFAYKNSLLMADQRSDIISNIDSVLQIGKYIIQAVLVFVLHSYYAYVLVLPVFTIINNLFIQYVTKKYYADYICKGHISSEVLTDIKKRVAGLIIYRLCGVSRNGFDSMFLSAYLGLSTVAIYNNYYLILTGVTSMLGVVSQAVSASIGNSIATESVKKNYQDFNLFNFFYMIGAGVLAVLLFTLYQPFMLLWLGREYLLPISVVIAFCLYFYVQKMGDIRAMYNDAAGLWWEQRYRTMIESATNILLNFILIQIWGVLGVVLSSLISLFFIGVIGSAYITFKYYFGSDRLWHYFVWQFTYLGSTIVIAAISYTVCEAWLSESTIQVFLERGALSLLICIVGNLFIYGRMPIFHRAVGFFRGLFSLLRQ